MRKILIIDDHPVVLAVMAAIAQNVFPDACVAALDCLAEAEKLLAANVFDLALVDLGMPGCIGIGALTALRVVAPTAIAVVISANEEPATIRAALDAGAKGYIPKTAKLPVIAAALRLIATGGTYVPPQALSEVQAVPDTPISCLTDRQREVLCLIAQGLANKAIAKQLRIAEDTVKQHAKAVYAALGISSRSQAVRAADRFGIKLN